MQSDNISATPRSHHASAGTADDQAPKASIRKRRTSSTGAGPAEGDKVAKPDASDVSRRSAAGVVSMKQLLLLGLAGAGAAAGAAVYMRGWQPRPAPSAAPQTEPAALTQPPCLPAATPQSMHDWASRARPASYNTYKQPQRAEGEPMRPASVHDDGNMKIREMREARRHTCPVQSSAPFDGNGYVVAMYGSTAGESVYWGCQVNGKREDTAGVMRHLDGTRYEGGFKAGLMEGQGMRKRPDGSLEVGEFKADKLNGYAKATEPNGNSCEGTFEADKLNGFGKCTWTDVGFYEGIFTQGEITGFGTSTYNNGDQYQGMHANGRPVDHGTWRWANGNTYAGTHENGLISGHGHMRWLSGTTYVGQFLAGKTHGHGVETYANGDQFVGTFEHGRQAEGKMTYADSVSSK